MDMKGRCLFILLIFIAGSVFAQKDSPQEIQRQRMVIVNDILTTDRPDSVETQRWVCFTGQEPSRVRDARHDGMTFTPDASDSCVAALERNGNDRTLPGLYKRLATELGGNPDGYAKLPKAIGAAVLSGDDKVYIGNHKVVTVTASIAFDAGFTVAYTGRAPKKQGMDPLKLKSVAESCLDERKDAATCFSVGYVYGAQSLNAR